MMSNKPIICAALLIICFSAYTLSSPFYGEDDKSSYKPAPEQTTTEQPCKLTCKLDKAKERVVNATKSAFNRTKEAIKSAGRKVKESYLKKVEEHKARHEKEKAKFYPTAGEEIYKGDDQTVEVGPPSEDDYFVDEGKTFVESSGPNGGGTSQNLNPTDGVGHNSVSTGGIGQTSGFNGGTGQTSDFNGGTGQNLGSNGAFGQSSGSDGGQFTLLNPNGGNSDTSSFGNQGSYGNFQPGSSDSAFNGNQGFDNAHQPAFNPDSGSSAGSAFGNDHTGGSGFYQGGTHSGGTVLDPIVPISSFNPADIVETTTFSIIGTFANDNQFVDTGSNVNQRGGSPQSAEDTVLKAKESDHDKKVKESAKAAVDSFLNDEKKRSSY